MKQENLFTENCIRTFRGNYVDPFNPDPSLLFLDDIAHALSMQPRFGGHLPVFYSVAQHCVECCRIAPNKERRAALFHDASEAYLIDIPSPIKKRLPEYYKAEDNLMKVLSKEFGFEYPLSQTVKEIDRTLLVLEWESVFIKTTPWKITPMSQEEARHQFIYHACRV